MFFLLPTFIHSLFIHFISLHTYWENTYIYKNYFVNFLINGFFLSESYNICGKMGEITLEYDIFILLKLLGKKV